MKLISLFDNNDIDDATKESYDNPDDDNDAGDYDDNDDDVVGLFLLLSEWPAVGDHSTTRDLPPPCSNYNHRRHRHYQQNQSFILWAGGERENVCAPPPLSLFYE